MDTINLETTGGTAADTQPLPSLETVTPGASAGGQSTGNLPPGASLGTGQPDAGEVKRKLWRERKKKQREAKRGTVPLPAGNAEPLPSVESEAVPGGLAQDVRAFVEELPLIDWTSEDIGEVVEELITVLQDSDRESIRKKCAKANLPAEVTREILDEVEMPKFCQKIFRKIVPRLAAKYLNMAKLDAAYKDEALVVVALLYYVWSKMSRETRIKKEVQAANP